MPLRPEPLTLTGWSLETGPPPVNAPLGHGKKTLGIPRQGRSGWLYYQCFRCEQHQKNRAGAPEFLMKGHSVFGVAWTVTGPWSSLGGRERTLPARLACITARPFLQGLWFSTGQPPPGLSSLLSFFPKGSDLPGMLTERHKETDRNKRSKKPLCSLAQRSSGAPRTKPSLSCCVC